MLLLLAIAGALVALREGVVPQRWLPFAPLDLAEPDSWFLDWRLAGLAKDPQLCRATLRQPVIDAHAVGDKPMVDGCGWTNAVRVAALSGAKLTVEPLSCQSAAALALWVAHDVQPVAAAMLGQRVVAIRHLGSYACRNVAGNPLFKHWRSAHATANAIDVAAFTLLDGQQISVQRHWHAEGREGAFLREIRARACRYFHVAIGPDYNAAHRDHFHLDRGVGHACR